MILERGRPVKAPAPYNRAMALTVSWLGDCALLLELGGGIDAPSSARALAAADALRAARLRGVIDVVPSYASVAVHLDPRAAMTRGDAIAAEAARVAESARGDARRAACTVTIPVAYGGDDGPDLERLAAYARLDAAEVVARHARGEYTVALLGFQPGFPYLLGLDPALAMPRLERPRTRVAAGSVGIAGAQTGIYASASPGGWNLVGRTGAALFDSRRAAPTLLMPGDRVRFREVDARALDAASVEVAP